LLHNIENALAASEVDLWGASFGATPELIHFWRQAGFSPVHVGLSRNVASGLHAALVLKPLSGRGVALLQEVQLKFHQHFPSMLAESYNDLEPQLVEQLFGGENLESLHTLSAQDWLDIKSFVRAARGYEVNSVPIWKLVCLCLANKCGIAELADTELVLVIAKVLQKKSWQEIVSDFSLSGQKQALQCLRQAVKKLYDCCVHNETVV
jgi:tRNA(Met) cytidine acetyltransferase